MWRVDEGRSAQRHVFILLLLLLLLRRGLCVGRAVRPRDLAGRRGGDLGEGAQVGRRQRRARPAVPRGSSRAGFLGPVGAMAPPGARIGSPVVDGPPAVTGVVVVCYVFWFFHISLVCVVTLLFDGQKMPPLGNVVDMVIVAVVLRLWAPRSAIVRLCPANGGAVVGSGGGGSSFGFDRGLFVLIGGFGLLEDVDYVLALFRLAKKNVVSSRPAHTRIYKSAVGLHLQGCGTTDEIEVLV